MVVVTAKHIADPQGGQCVLWYRFTIYLPCTISMSSAQHSHWPPPSLAPLDLSDDTLFNSLWSFLDSTPETPRGQKTAVFIQGSLVQPLVWCVP